MQPKYNLMKLESNIKVNSHFTFKEKNTEGTPQLSYKKNQTKKQKVNATHKQSRRSKLALPHA